MRVEMTFSDDGIAATGHTRHAIYYTIKKAFAKHGLRCVSEDELLAFEDNGGEDDFAYMWNVMFSLVRSNWFMRCAASLVFIEDGETEDVLAQAGKIRGREKALAEWKRVTED